MNDNALGARGPWKFDSPSLAAGETWTLDLRNRQYNGQKGYFRNHMPLDNLQVSNRDGSNPLLVDINGVHQATVVPSAAETYNDVGLTHLTITNDGGSSISKGDVSVEISKSAYDADDRAREQAQRTLAERVIEGVTGIKL